MTNAQSPLDVVVAGNVTLDVLCHPVDDVPRFESIGFEDVRVSPGGCGSNTAIGLAVLGMRTALAACMGRDDTAELLTAYWKRAGVDLRFLVRQPEEKTGVSVALVDHDYQPRFIHTSGANKLLTTESLDPDAYAAAGARYLHVAGYFVLPGLYDERLAEVLARAQARGLHTSLDVVTSPRMEDVSPLLPCLEYLDVLMCNDHEAARLTGEKNPEQAAARLRALGAQSAIVKLGAKGCLADSDEFRGIVPAQAARAVDTTGAGDAFAAGYLAARAAGADIESACKKGNQAGARVVTALGAVTAWFPEV